ncbi:hypothetical protein Tco_0336806 [Tanacetum coccineum]
MKRVNTFVDFRTKLVEESSSKRAGDELEQESIKKQKVDEDTETTELQSLMQVIPNEEEVAIDAIPLATKPPTIVDWKIHKKGKNNYYQIIRADGSSKMYMVFSLMLKSFDRKHLEDLYKLGRTFRIKRLFDDLRVTAAKLMLLVQKLLLLVLKVNVVGIKVTTAERLQLLEEFTLTKNISKTYQRKNKDFLKIKITYVIKFNMSRTNSQAEIVSEEQLVPRANRLVIKKNN